MQTLIIVIHLMIVIAMIGFVLLQKSEGGGLGIGSTGGFLTGRGTSIPLLDNRGDASLFDVMEECERHIINDMLEKCAWNQTEAADRFHIPLSTLNQKIKRLSIEIKKKTRE